MSEQASNLPALALVAAMQIDVAAEAPAVAGTPAALPRFRMVAYTGGPMKVGAWRYPVIVDLAGLSIPSQSRPIRFGHDAASGVGHTDTIRVDNGQLVATGVVSRDTSAAREIVVSSKNGFPWQASIGASVDEFEFVKEGQKVIVNGRSFDGPVNVVRKATLGEISFVDLGADGNTSAQVAATRPHPENRTMETTPVAATAPQTTPAPETPAAFPAHAAPTPAIQAAAPASAAAAPEPAQSAADVRAEALVETTRIAAIRSVCNGRFAEIEAQAIREGWDATRTELEVLRAGRPKAPVPAAPQVMTRSEDGGVTARVLEAACFMTAKFEGVEKLFDEPTLAAADAHFRGGMGLQELLLEAAWANGYTGKNFRDTKSVMQHAFAGPPSIRASASTIDIGGILSNVANKFLLDGFFSVERTWRNICAVRNVNDFKTVTSYRLIGTDQYEQVSPGGELKHGTLGNETYTNKADTYGLMLAVGRRRWNGATCATRSPAAGRT